MPHKQDELIDVKPSKLGQSIRRPVARLSRSEKALRNSRRKKFRAKYCRKRRTNFLRNRNRKEFGKSKRERKNSRRGSNQKARYFHVKAPSMLSFVSDPDGMVEFIDKVRNCFESRIPVFVELQHVQSIGYDGVAVLLSAVVRFKATGIRLNGSTPHDPKVYDELAESKFFDYLYDKKFRDQDSYSLTSRDSIHTHAMRAVDSVLGEKLIEGASKTIWGESRRCPGAQRALIEQMQNTNNHASLDAEGEKHWWLSLHHDFERKRVEFSFVDYGVGVFHNLENKKEGSKFFRILDSLSVQ